MSIYLLFPLNNHRTISRSPPLISIFLKIITSVFLLSQLGVNTTTIGIFIHMTLKMQTSMNTTIERITLSGILLKKETEVGWKGIYSSYPKTFIHTSNSFSFPNLRIVKRTEGELKNYGALRVFDSPGKHCSMKTPEHCLRSNLDALSTSQLSSPKDTIKEFNLDRLQLGFTLGREGTVNGIPTKIPFAATTVFSDEVVKMNTTRSHTPKPIISQIYKYLPRKGFSDGNDEIVVFFTNKLKSNRYGSKWMRFSLNTNSVSHFLQQI